MIPTLDSELKSVVRRMYGIAEAFYDNDLQTNILAVYNRLNDQEQTVVLKSMIPLLFGVENPPKVVREQIDMPYDDYNIEAINAIEMIKLKSWIVKCGLIFGSSLFILTTICTFITALLPDKHLGHMVKLFEFIRIVFVD